MYANHTQLAADAYTPNIIFWRRNNVIVGPDAFSIPGVRTMVAMLGGLPLPSTLEGTINFTRAIQKLAEKGQHITIYPEAHIWPYYTDIRPFVSGSFRYPVNAKKPVLVLTNTYVPVGKRGKRFRLLTHIDGPFYPDLSIDKKEAIEKLRNEVYDCMVKRAKEVKQFEHFRYIDRRNIEVN